MPGNDVIVHYPAGSELTEIQNIFSEIVVRNKRRSVVSLSMYSLALPISFAFTILPGPNIVLAANCFRLYSLYHSFNASKLIISNIENTKFVCHSDKTFNWMPSESNCQHFADDIQIDNFMSFVELISGVKKSSHDKKADIATVRDFIKFQKKLLKKETHQPK